MGWDRPPTLFADDVENAYNIKYRAFIGDFYNNLVMLSPVDTGRYKNNHHISFNAPSYAVDGAFGLVFPPTGAYPTVYIQNNLPYALRLEHGHSKQAPTGVYGNAFWSAIATIR